MNDFEDYCRRVQRLTKATRLVLPAVRKGFEAEQEPLAFAAWYKQVFFPDSAAGMANTLQQQHRAQQKTDASKQGV